MLKKHLDYWLLAALVFLLVAIVAPAVTNQVMAHPAQQLTQATHQAKMTTTCPYK